MCLLFELECVRWCVWHICIACAACLPTLPATHLHAHLPTHLLARPPARLPACLPACVLSPLHIPVISPFSPLHNPHYLTNGNRIELESVKVNFSFITFCNCRVCCCLSMVQYPQANTVKPALVTTCIQRPPLFKDHLVVSQLWLYHAFLPVLRDHLYSRTAWSCPNCGFTMHFYLYSETTSIQGPLGRVPIVALPCIFTCIKRPPLFKDHLFWPRRGRLIQVSL